MATPAYERLGRVIDLEEMQGWRNRGVIGGMGAMSERWEADAREEGADEAGVDAIILLMAQYEDGSPETRPAIAQAIREALDGKLPEAPPPAPDETREPDPEPDARADEADLPDWSDDDELDEESAWEGSGVSPAEPTHVARERVRREQARRPNVDPHDLQASPTILPGVGPARAEQLARLGIHQVIDLLWHLPARYEDFSQLRTISQLKPGEEVTIVANLWEMRERKVGMNRQMVQGILADGTGTLHATWWNKWIAKKLETGTTMRFSGKVGLYLGQKTLDNPVFEEVDADMVATGRLAPVYPLTEGISNNWLRNLIQQVLDDYGHFLSDPLPEEIRTTYNLPDLATSFQQVHLPDDHESLHAALRRLAFEELFYLQLGVLQRRQELKGATALALVDDGSLVERFRKALPFQLTGAQARVLDEVTRDMARTSPMTRLLQGDVGSGKTAVAAGAMYVAAGNGVQSACWRRRRFWPNNTIAASFA